MYWAIGLFCLPCLLSGIIDFPECILTKRFGFGTITLSWMLDRHFMHCFETFTKRSLSLNPFCLAASTLPCWGGLPALSAPVPALDIVWADVLTVAPFGSLLLSCLGPEEAISAKRVDHTDSRLKIHVYRTISIHMIVCILMNYFAPQFLGRDVWKCYHQFHLF